MKIYNEAVVTGVPKLSDAFIINGQPGDLYPCSNGMYLEQKHQISTISSIK